MLNFLNELKKKTKRTEHQVVLPLNYFNALLANYDRALTMLKKYEYIPGVLGSSRLSCPECGWLKVVDGIEDDPLCGNLTEGHDPNCPLGNILNEKT